MGELFIPNYGKKPSHWKPSGRRIKRGLYRCESGLINADVNGSYNILRKEFPNAFSQGISGCLVPLGITCIPDNLKLHQKYKVEVLGIKPFHASKPEFDFIDKCAEAAFYAAKKAAIQAVIPNPNLLPPL